MTMTDDYYTPDYIIEYVAERVGCELEWLRDL